MSFPKNLLGIVIASLATAILAYVTMRLIYPPMSPDRHQVGAAEPARNPKGVYSGKISELDNVLGGEENSETSQMPMILNAGGVNLPLIFEDSDVPPKIRNLVIADLNLVYGHLHDSEFLSPIRSKPVRILGTDYTPVAYLNFIGTGRYFPPQLREMMGLVIEKDGRKLVIPSEMSALYAEAEKRIHKYSPAYSQVADFIENINTISSSATITAKDLILLHPSAAEFQPVIDTMDRKEILQTVGGGKFRRPSVLEITESDKSSPGVNWSLAAPTYRIVKGELKESSTPMVYSNGRWRILLARF